MDRERYFVETMNSIERYVSLRYDMNRADRLGYLDVIYNRDNKNAQNNKEKSEKLFKERFDDPAQN